MPPFPFSRKTKSFSLKFIYCIIHFSFKNLYEFLMFQKQEGDLLTAPLFLDQGQRSILREEVLKSAFRFPNLFDRSIYRSYEQMVVNSPTDFLATRSHSHLRLILSAQFFTQKKIEANIQSCGRKQLVVKLFRGPSRVCIACAYSASYCPQKEQLLKALETFLPGISEIPLSFYLFHSAENNYYYCYFEVKKLRGDELSAKQLRDVEKKLKELLLASTPLTPAIFWPYNKEESHRQTQLLIREMNSEQDLPHISIHFQEQTATSLEFLIHLVRPKMLDPLPLEKLPESLYSFRYSNHTIQTPFPIEIDVFSIRMHSQIFDVQDTINLLYARRYLMKYLETIIGPFRDYNGGLFEKQQDQFETVRFRFSSKIPYFDLFAEKLFYALHPFEKWFSFTEQEMENLFTAFSDLIQDERSNATQVTDSFTVVKMENKTDFFRFTEKKATTHAQLTIGNFYYECFSGPITDQIETILQNPIREDRTLQLIFQEGSPPSLNPHYASSDMRCRLLSKMLFEGLTRLNEEGLPELAAAVSEKRSPDGLVYIFQLRKACWSNGEKVTAFDFADSWKWALQDTGSHPELLFCIKNAEAFRAKICPSNELGIRVIDPETLQIELKEPDPEFLIKLSQPYFFPSFGMQREPKWFNGPYLVEEVKKSGIRLARNPYYWKTKEIEFEYVEIEWLNDTDEIYNRFNEGKIDWIGDPLTILSLDQIQELTGQGKLLTQKVNRRFSLHFNTHHPILSSYLIRQALSLAIDRSQICQEIFPHSIPVAINTYSKELAASFFEEGLRELKLTRANFPPLRFTYSDQTRRDLLANYLQKTWLKVLGIEVHLEKLEWNSFRSRLEKRAFELCGTIQDTINHTSLNYLQRLEGPNSWNFSQWSHLVYRELILQAQNENDTSKKQKLKTQAENILYENVPFTPLFDYTHLYSLNNRYSCSYFDQEGCVDFSQGKTLGK